VGGVIDEYVDRAQLGQGAFNNGAAVLVRTLSVVPQWLHMNATRPGPPPNGAISATFDIGRPHHLQAFSDTTFIVLPLELGLF
jgi:hypothetical protein